MKLLSFEIGGQQRLGLMKDENIIIDVQLWGKNLGSDFPSSMLDLIDRGEDFWGQLTGKAENLSEGQLEDATHTLDEVKILAPIPRPRKNIFGIGLNYTEHVAESARALDTSNQLPKQCIIFSKPPTTVIATGEAIRHNGNVTKQMDWEGELAVIIGKKGFRISKDNAMDHVFGYSIINDISARDCRRSGQWIVSKGMDTFAPMGPFLLTKNDIPDPHNLDIVTKVNGVEKQNGNTKFMLFNIPAIIEDISKVISLEPGDIIASGTPAGVGAGRDPQEWMWPGDEVEVTISGIGTLKNHIVDDTY